MKEHTKIMYYIFFNYIFFIYSPNLSIQIIKAVSHVYHRWTRNLTYIYNDLSFSQSTYNKICTILSRIEGNYLAMRGREAAIDCNWLSSSTKSSSMESGRRAITKPTSFSSPPITRCSSASTPSSYSTSASSSGILCREWDLKCKI